MSERLRSIPRQPAEGWISLLLVFVLAACLAWSIADARWVIGKGELTAFLPFAAAGGVGWGFISAKVGWSRWRAHLLGAIFAGLLLPIMVGGVLNGGDFMPGPAFVATASSAIGAYLDLAYRGKAFTQEYGHFMLILGIICWANGQFTSYAVFGHHRPLNAVIMSGIALVLNMSLTLDEQLGILIWFSLAALFLLIRLHALDERSTWLRHRLGDAGSLSNFYLRGGTAFITVAVLGALILTSTAASAPLASLWRGVDQRLVEMTHGLEAVFRGGGSGTRISPVDFLSSTRISGEWVTDPTPVLSIKVPDGGDYHWGAVAYDDFDGHGWTVTNPQNTDVAAGAPLITDSLDDPAGLLDRKSLTFQVSEINYDPAAVFSPDLPTKVSIGTSVGYLGTSPNRFAGLVTKSGAADYQVTAQVPNFATTAAGAADPNALTANKLRVAGTAYPAAVRGYYLQLDPVVDKGPNTLALLAAIKAAHPDAKNPYDISKAIETYLKSEGGFKYSTDLSKIDCANDGVAECFARTKIGYCEYYASTMVVLLRMEGIPARFVEGFLPSKPDANGVELILKSAAHAWVEVYFPSYGWITFDPTGGGVGQDPPIVSGAKVTPLPTISSEPLGSIGPDATDPRRTPNLGEPPPAGGAGSTGGPGGGGFIVIGLLLAAIMGGLVFLAWQRGPRKAQEPDRIYGGVVGLARRFGFGPRANQTVYEYAGSLGDILPSARPDLHTVAVAKVEVAYGRRTLEPSRMDALLLAQRHLRIALLGLIFRRAERRARHRNRPRG
jgi:transglutaminase-like putative cysteine protease